MTLPQVNLIDWRRQFAALEPFLTGRGGVIVVRASGAAPISNFAKAVRQVMDERSTPSCWTSVQIDPFNSNTHYLADIVVQLEQKLGLLDGGESLVDPRVVVGSDIEAGGAVQVSNVSVTYQGNALEQATQLQRRALRIGTAIREMAPDRRLALIFVNSDSSEMTALGGLCSVLWDPVLKGLVAECGVVVIDISDTGAVRDGAWPPDPDLVLDLPERYDDTDRGHAEDDITNIVIDQGCRSSEHEARIVAQTLLSTSDDVRDLHARVSSFLLNTTRRAY